MVQGYLEWELRSNFATFILIKCYGCLRDYVFKEYRISWRNVQDKIDIKQEPSQTHTHTPHDQWFVEFEDMEPVAAKG